jgi:CHAD domain-containing protein
MKIIYFRLYSFNFAWSNIIRMSLSASFSDSICAYHTERWRHIRQSLKEASENPDVATVHHARVEIKKLTALYEFLEYCGDGECVRALHPLHRVFKLLGRLRDHSNSVDLCHEFKMDTAVIEKRNASLRKIHKQIKVQLEKHKGTFRKIKHTYSKQCRHTDSVKWKKYLTEKYVEVRTMTSSPTAEHLHHARKCIKYLLYNAQLSGGTAKTIKNAEALDKLQDLLGRWHDLVVFHEALIETGTDLTHHALYTAVMRKEKKLRREISDSIVLCFRRPARSRVLLL